MKVHTIIVGGGVAGLYCASIIGSGIHDVMVLESKSQVGGRIETIVGEKGPLYDRGAWRIPTTHTRALKFVENARTITAKPQRKKSKTTSNSSLSIFDTKILATKNIAYAHQMEHETGYGGIHDQASNSRRQSYISDETVFVVPQDGMKSIVTKLAQHTKDANVPIRTNVHVSNIYYKNKEYHIHTNKGTFMSRVVILAVPPHVIQTWSGIRTQTRLLCDAITTLSLCHIVSNVVIDGHTILPDSPLQQVVASTYKNGYSQVSYSSGRIADFWQHLYIDNKTLFRDVLAECLKSVDIQLRSDNEVEVCYWNKAIHMWRPGYRFDLHRASQRALSPSKECLPRLYCIGEAFSRYQGWAEGALQTVEDLIVSWQDIVPEVQVHKTCVVVDGIKVYIPDDWLQKHPGGRQAILNHVKDKDIRASLSRIGHSHYALSSLFYLS